MRNLKRVLSLALAVVMVIGMMVMGTSAADFTDKAEIDYAEAVDVMSALGILEGYDDGNFKPDVILTREQAAKIICYMLMGPENAEMLTGSKAFADVEADRWSAPYISYCSSLGIIAGMGDGTFNPEGKLTGVAFAKLLLVALGYDAEIEGYVNNANWSTKIGSDAVEAGLNIPGVSLDAAVTREQAAQMALNAIKTPMVEYATKGSSISVNGAEIVFGSSKAEYVTTTLAKDQRISDQKLTNTGYYTVEFGEKYFPNLYLQSGRTDDFGRPSHAWAYKTEDIGEYVDMDLLVKEYTTGTAGKTVYGDIGYSQISDYAVEAYVDGKAIDDASGIVKSLTKTEKKNVDNTGNGVLTQVFVDHDKEIITFVFINTYLAEVDTDYNATLKRAPITVYVKNGTSYIEEAQTLSGEKYADLAEKDMLLVTRAYNDNTGKYAVKSVELAEVISGAKITSYTSEAKNTLKNEYELKTLVADGTNYKTSAKTCYDVTDVLNYNKDLTALKNSTYDLYMDKYGYVMGLKQVKTVDKYVFVVGYEVGSSYLAQAIDQALIITMDGEMKTVKAMDNKPNGTSVFAASDAAVNAWHSYDIKADGTYVIGDAAAAQGAVISESRVADENKADISGLYADLGNGTAGKAVAYGNAGSIYITVDADTSVAADGSIVKVNGITTGIKNTNVVAADVSAMDNFDADTFYLYNPITHYVTCAVVVGEDVTTSDNMVFFTSGATGRYYDSDLKGFYVTYEAIKGGELTTIKVLDACATDVNPATNELYKATFTADGYIKSLTEKNDHAADNTTGNKVGYTWNVDPTGIELKLIGATLWVIEADANNNYVVIDDNCKVFFDSAADKDGYIEYPTVKSALGALAGDEFVVAKVTTICDTLTGYANTLIITEAKKAAAPADPVPPTGDEDPVPPTGDDGDNTEGDATDGSEAVTAAKALIDQGYATWTAEDLTNAEALLETLETEGETELAAELDEAIFKKQMKDLMDSVSGLTGGTQTVEEDAKEPSPFEAAKADYDSYVEKVEKTFSAIELIMPMLEKKVENMSEDTQAMFANLKTTVETVKNEVVPANLVAKAVAVAKEATAAAEALTEDATAAEIAAVDEMLAAALTILDEQAENAGEDNAAFELAALKAEDAAEKVAEDLEAAEEAEKNADAVANAQTVLAALANAREEYNTAYAALDAYVDCGNNPHDENCETPALTEALQKAEVTFMEAAIAYYEAVEEDEDFDTYLTDAELNDLKALVALAEGIIDVDATGLAAKVTAAATGEKTVVKAAEDAAEALLNTNADITIETQIDLWVAGVNESTKDDVNAYLAAVEALDTLLADLEDVRDLLATIDEQIAIVDNTKSIPTEIEAAKEAAIEAYQSIVDDETLLNQAKAWTAGAYVGTDSSAIKVEGYITAAENLANSLKAHAEFGKKDGMSTYANLVLTVLGGVEITEENVEDYLAITTKSYKADGSEDTKVVDYDVTVEGNTITVVAFSETEGELESQNYEITWTNEEAVVDTTTFKTLTGIKYLVADDGETYRLIKSNAYPAPSFETDITDLVEVTLVNSAVTSAAAYKVGTTVITYNNEELSAEELTAFDTATLEVDDEIVVTIQIVDIATGEADMGTLEFVFVVEMGTVA